MPVDERSRRRLHERLEDVLGTEHAETLMAHLRLLGQGDDLARKSDIELLRQEIALSEQRTLATMNEKFTGVYEAIHDVYKSVDGIYDAINVRTRSLVFSVIGAILTTAAIAFATAHLA